MFNLKGQFQDIFYSWVFYLLKFFFAYSCDFTDIFAHVQKHCGVIDTAESQTPLKPWC